MINPSNQLAGKRYINLVRCSTDQQTETSIPAQLELLNAFAAANQMVHVDDVILDGVSGSKPGNRDDIGEIITRKKTKNDFDVLLVQTEDRQTRGGSEHGNWMRHELIRNGIQLVFASSDAPEGSYGSLIRTFKYESAQEMAKTISLRSSQGFQRARENGQVTTCTHAPFGTHRLYRSADGKPLFILRDNGDGTQHKLDLESREMREVYGEVAGGAKGHYRKQRSEKVLLVEGEAAEMAVVRRIFQRKYIDGLGGRRIARELNAERIAAPEGGTWTQRQVDVISENEVYTGVGVANRVSSGQFYQRARTAPEAVSIDPTVRATKKTTPIRLRPPEDWEYQEQPYLKNFLPEPLRTIAAEKIRQLWTDRCNPARVKRAYNSHPDSDYLLTGILTAVEDGRRLKGYTSGPTGRHVRYYVHPLAQQDPSLAGFPNKLFRADVLETAVLAAVAEILMAMPNLKSEVDAAVRSAMEQKVPPKADEIADLMKQKQVNSAHIKSLLEMLRYVPEEAKPKIFLASKEQQRIDDQLRLASEGATTPTQDPAALVASIIDRLKNLGGNISSLPTYQLRQVLAAMIATATIGMTSGDVQIELRIPPDALSDVKTAIATLSLRQTSPSSMWSWAQQDPSLVFARLDCQLYREGQKPCAKCSRRVAA